MEFDLIPTASFSELITISEETLVKIKAKNNIVSFSGGRSSRVLVHIFEELKKQHDIQVTYIFMDTGAEHPLTYKFIRDIVEFYDIDLTCIHGVFSTKEGVGPTYKEVPITKIGWNLEYWEKMLEAYSTPYVVGAFCTEKLKGEPCRKWLKDNFLAGSYQHWWGIREDESQRLVKKDGVSYLAEICDFDKNEVLKWSNNQEVDLELQHEALGNCLFCIKKGASKISLGVALESEKADEFIKIIESDTVRIIPTRVGHRFDMYRGNMSLRAIKQMSKNESVKHLARLINNKNSDTGNCSESCEPNL